MLEANVSSLMRVFARNSEQTSISPFVSNVGFLYYNTGLIIQELLCIMYMGVRAFVCVRSKTRATRVTVYVSECVWVCV